MPKPLSALAGFLLLALLADPQRADARGILLITHGDQIRELKPAADAPVNKLSGGLKVGYLSSYGGVFWLDFWTWGGKYCLYRGKECEVIEPKMAAMLLGVPENKLPKPFFYRFPLGLFILAMLALGFGLLAALGHYSTWSQKKRARKLITDPDYQDAMRLPAGKRADFLASRGVPEREIEPNLRVLAATFESAGES